MGPPEGKMRGYIQKAETLIEALPYIREFNGKTVVVKYGGAAMKDDSRMASFAEDIVLLQFVGIRPVVVHGGGPQIDRMLSLLSIPTERKEGLRVTSPAAMEVVEMVLGGTVNKRIVALIDRFGGKAVGLCGPDGGLIRARKIDARSRATGEPLDLGLVGEVEGIRPEILRSLEERGFVPVIAPIGVGPDGEIYNINGDTAAAEVAAAVSAEKFILLTDVAGVLDGNGERISTMTEAEATDAIRSGAITGGMIPKVECGLTALRKGVRKVHVLDGRIPHSVLLEIFTDAGVGTEIVRSPAEGGGR
jgi:acetylglutamate kinase